MTILLLAALCLLLVHAVAAAAPIEQWGRFEAAFDGPTTGCPYVDVRLSATFSRGGERIVVPGFWDGGATYRIRFMPPAPGEWRYRTSSNRPELDGRTGTFVAVPPRRGNHGPVRVAHTWHFAYADGTPYFPVGTTCYAWIHQPEALQEQTLKTLASSPFNKIRFCVFPKSYVYNQNDPEVYAFSRRSDGTFDFSRPDPAFWRHLERRILDLERLGIEADLILWHPYDRWGFAEMGRENDDRHLRYCIARLSAFRNVWWSLANEYDAMAPQRPTGHRGDKTAADWDRFFRILRDEDPVGHLRSIHNMGLFYDHTREWVTHASIQRHDLAAVLQWRQEFKKPIVVDECGYEGDIPQGWGNLTARDLVRRFWIGALRGGYVGHGETYRHPDEILWWSKGGVLRGESPSRIAFLKKTLSAVPFHELIPREEAAPGVYQSGKPGLLFAYFTDPVRATIRLDGDRRYRLDGIDPWEGTVTPLGTVPPGEQTVTPPKADYLFRWTVCQPGEPLGLEVKAGAVPAEGVAPLDVRFTVDAAGPVRWEFGDGETSSEPRPRHTYRRSGFYVARVTVTGPGGPVTQFVPVIVDRDASVPIVRAGFAGGESPSVTLHGPVARDKGGAFVYGDQAPWGWVGIGDGPLPDLQGLRSFTLCGWVRPTTLTAGSGGNRIAFSLKERSGGFDLVHLADGRLRLAVNEWPDGVKNDSSPGVLKAGEWTYFAVTYDATKEAENVRWYFGGNEKPVTFDRASSYSAGPTGFDGGRLTIGNYNETMHGYGLDRQFRGTIRGVRIYGSRIDGRGALPLARLRELQRE